MNDIRVASWVELPERLFADSWKPELARFRSDYAFRGAADASDDLRTSLVRLGSPYASLETDLLRNFRKYAGADPALQPAPVRGKRRGW
ncbi:MAG: hypothetical protein ACRDH2_15515 [Anaerolineales bacterium]